MATERHTTRRALLKAAPAAMVIGAGAAVAATPTEDETFRLIEACRVAQRAYEAAGLASDWVALGRRPTSEEIRACDAAGDAFCDAEIALCEYASPTLAGSKAKADFIAAKFERGTFDGSEQMEALLRSVAQMVRV